MLQCRRIFRRLLFQSAAKLDIATVEALFQKTQEEAVLAAEEKEAKWNTENAGGTWDAAKTANMMLQTCFSCGAELVSDGNTMATKCAYCDNPNMIPRRFDGMLRPDFVIPFKKTKEGAIAAPMNAARHKYLTPCAIRQDRCYDCQSPDRIAASKSSIGEK